MKLSERQRLFSYCLWKLLHHIYCGFEYEVTFGEVWRTQYQQAKYVKDGKSWTMNSKHLERCAVDLNIFIDDVYQTDHDAYIPLGKYWEALHPQCKWGGNWKQRDSGHFEVD